MRNRNSSESVKSFGETAQLFAAMAKRTASHKASCAYNVVPTWASLPFHLTYSIGTQSDTQRLVFRINQLRF